jgi:two-component system, sensor histidine kinase and response regulator
VPLPSPTASAVELEPECPTRKGTLLVVDDEDGPRQSLRVIFKDDYNILMASDGPTAIELAQKNRVDVAVLDIRMAGMSGIEVLERLKYVEPAIEVIMMTAFETTDTMRQALQLRACDYINKPFDLATIRRAVAAAMKRRMLERDTQGDEEKVQALLRELHEQKVEEQMAQSRGEIYASIIHDINGPLTVIAGYAHLLSQRLEGKTVLEEKDVDFVRERLNAVSRHTGNCISISRRYLSFLRRRGDEPNLVSLNQLFSDVEHLAVVHPSRQRHRLTVHRMEKDLAVRMNGTDVIQVLLNLVVNAFQCSPAPLTVEVAGQCLGERLDLTTFKDGPGDRFLNVENFDNVVPLAKVSVQDTGPGIPPELLPKIFQPFFSTKGASKGTGLGLNIIHRLIREARGALHVQTRPGEGTTFAIYLPAAMNPASNPVS